MSVGEVLLAVWLGATILVVLTLLGMAAADDGEDDSW